MGFSNTCVSVLSSNSKALALESTLQQSIVNFKELLADFEQLQVECEGYKLQLVHLKENKCDSLKNDETVILKKVIATKDQIIQSVASSLTKLNDTKDWNVLTEAFKILFQDAPPSPTFTEHQKNSTDGKKNPSPPKLSLKKEKSTEKHETTKLRHENNQLKVSCISSSNVSIIEDMSFNEESVCEIEGTPTGRTSPIIQTKMTRNLLGKSSDYRDKKKCPDDWPTSKSKTYKQTSTPSRKGGRLKQSRINLVQLKQMAVVDLTSSPKSQQENPLIKKESIENDDTILPSPTSGPTSFNLLKTVIKDSPSKFKRPLSLKVKLEKGENEPKFDEKSVQDDIAMDDSINILNQQQNRLRNGIEKERTKEPMEAEPALDEDATHCETNSSLSLLDHVSKIERDSNRSPVKRPLAENINIINTPPKLNEASMSLLYPDLNKEHNSKDAVENIKRKLPELVEPIYKEPTVRNKIEKRNLQGWSCEECKNFYGELYKNDPVMLAKKINECSKHRGRHNPERPKTPPNFWNPRWNVPTDTEELNRMNNAI